MTDDAPYRPKRRKLPVPPAYEPETPDPEMQAQLEASVAARQAQDRTQL